MTYETHEEPVCFDEVQRGVDGARRAAIMPFIIFSIGNLILVGIVLAAAWSFVTTGGRSVSFQLILPVIFVLMLLMLCSSIAAGHYRVITQRLKNEQEVVRRTLRVSVDSSWAVKAEDGYGDPFDAIAFRSTDGKQFMVDRCSDNHHCEQGTVELCWVVSPVKLHPCPESTLRTPENWNHMHPQESEKIWSTDDTWYLNDLDAANALWDELMTSGTPPHSPTSVQED